MKRIISLLLSVCVIFGMSAGLDLTAYADLDVFTQGYYQYYISEDVAVISSCDKKISGNITIPSTLGGYPVSVIEYAFQDCKNITGITIPESVQLIWFAFDGCNKLKYINVAPENQCYASIDGVLYDKDITELIYYPANRLPTSYNTHTAFVLPYSVKKVSDWICVNNIYVFRNLDSESIDNIDYAKIHTNNSSLMNYCKKNKINYCDIKDDYINISASGYSENSLNLNVDIDGFSYKYYIYNDATKKYELIYSGDNSCCSVSDLKKNTSYKFKVKRYYEADGKIIYESKATDFIASTISKSENPINKKISFGANAVVKEKHFSNSNFEYTSDWNKWEGVSDISQFNDEMGNMYFEYLSKNKLVVNKLNDNLSTSVVFTAKKEMPLLGTVITDGKGYFYAVWGKSGEKEESTAIKIVKYNSSGKKIKSTSYTHKEIDTVIPFEAGNCDAKISNGIMYCIFSKERYDGHQQAIEVVLNSSTMKKLPEARYFWCSHSFAQRAFIDRNGEIWYANQGDCYPRSFLINGPYGANEAFHFYAATSDYENMPILNETKAKTGGIVETSRGVFFIGASVKALDKKGYKSSDTKNIFITSADGSFKLKDASSRTGSVFDEKITDKNIKWLTNYKSDKSVETVQVVQTDNDNIVIIWEESEIKKDKSLYYNVYYMILDCNGNISQNPTKIKNAHLNYDEAPIYKNGCVYWLGDSSKSGTGIYKLKLGKVK